MPWIAITSPGSRFDDPPGNGNPSLIRLQHPVIFQKQLFITERLARRNIPGMIERDVDSAFGQKCQGEVLFGLAKHLPGKKIAGNRPTRHENEPQWEIPADVQICMKLDAPFLIAKNFLTDFFFNRRALYQSLVRYECIRSCSFPAGNLPLADIFDFVPDAASRRVCFENMFEVPFFTRGLPREAERYTASTGLGDSYFLALIASAFAKESILEVGTSFGQSALLFALNTPDNVKITTLDIQPDNPNVGSCFKGHRLSHRISQRFSTLKQIAPDLTPRSFDMIFIDGNHSYAGVMEDSLTALSLVRPGGVLCWHDYVFMFRHDVVRALDELKFEKGIDVRRLAYVNLSAAIIP